MEKIGKCPYMKMRTVGESNVGAATENVPYPGNNYMDYLKIEELLKLHVRLTDDPISHDEHLFISVHQNFEVWFQQILFELKSIKLLLGEPKVCEKKQQLIFQRLARVNCIFRIMIQQFEVLETMSSVNFASFREIFQGGASGFQSSQFRILEQVIGIKEEQRTCTFLNSYNSMLTEEQRLKINENSNDDICTLVDRWLSRTPGVKVFSKSYKNTVEDMIKDLRFRAKIFVTLDPAKSKKLEMRAKDMETENAMIFDQEKYEKGGRIHGRKLSYNAFMGALMINCYPSEPRFTVPYEIIKNLMDMDTFLTKWRFAHAMMVKRMIGGRPGTGGSGGYSYLRSTVSDRYMPFIDLFEVATYVIPPQKLPKLDSAVLREISTFYTEDDNQELGTNSGHSRSNSLSSDADSSDSGI